MESLAMHHVEMTKEAARAWEYTLARTPSTAHIAINLGHAAFEKAMQHAQENPLLPEMRLEMSRIQELMKAHVSVSGQMEERVKTYIKP
jgi:hypothetical protein